jgi:hypothetical protein
MPYDQPFVPQEPAEANISVSDIVKEVKTDIAKIIAALLAR